MPTFQITAPDGRQFRVTGPAGSTREEALQHVQSQLAASVPQADPLQELAQEQGPIGAAMIGAGKTFSDIGRGAQDLYYRATGDQVARDNLAMQQAGDERRYAPLAAESPIATTIGEAAPYLAIPGVGPAASLPVRVGVEAAIGGGLGGLEYDQNALTGAAFGAGGGLAGHALGAGLRRLAGDQTARVLPPEHTQMLQEAEQLGYKVTPAQRLQSDQLAKLEAGLSRHALTSPGFARIEQQNQDIVNRIGREAIGESPNGQLSDGVLQNAHERIGAEFDRLTPKGHAFDLANDADFLDDFTRIDQEFMRSPVRGDQWPRIRDQVLDWMDEPLTLASYQRAASDLAGKARQQSRGDSGDPILANALFATREALDAAFERSVGPQAREALQTARTQYRWLKTLERPGVIKQDNLKVQPLRNVLKREQGGRLHLQDPVTQVARVGHKFAPQIPTSGTAEGLAAQNMMAAPTPSALAALAGPALVRSYIGGQGALSRGQDIGQAMANRLSQGVGGYGSPAQLGRVAGLSQAPQEVPAPLAAAGNAAVEAAFGPQAQAQTGPVTVAAHLPLSARLVGSIANTEWGRKWLSDPVKKGTTIQGHRTRLGLLSAGADLTGEQRKAVQKIQEYLKQLQKIRGK